ncbi:MAG: hypothetical protein QY331_10760 [Melioribacteraceae bacterium]|nr:hypothetical protein [Melioribacteraceae bacterium]WKZ68432.1 MAG: hypothetical protein QY331_10760 [Melioribacteraceae bacterium]
MDSELILKYLSGLLDEREVETFNEKIKNDLAFSEEFEKIKLSLDTFNKTSDIEVEEKYFINITPRVRQKIQNRAQTRSLRFAPVFSFIIAVILIIILQIPNNYSLQENFTSNNNSLSNIFENIDLSESEDFFETGMIDQSDYYSYEFSAENLNEFINSEIFSEIEDVDDLSYTGEIYSLSNYEDYSTEDVAYVYETLINKKIL